MQERQLNLPKVFYMEFSNDHPRLPGLLNQIGEVFPFTTIDVLGQYSNEPFFAVAAKAERSDKGTMTLITFKRLPEYAE